MSFRTVIITKNCKCTYKNDHLVVYGDEVKMIHLSEINTVLFDTTAVSITSYLLCELTKRKISVIFCDEKHNPISELLPIYGSHNTSKKIKIQIDWQEEIKKEIWTKIIFEKIRAQAWILEKMGKEEYNQLLEYSENIEFGDMNNREGHAAKVYFNSLFGKKFGRNQENSINAALNYGYSILLSTFNKEVVSNGYLTQLGINHKNEYNHFNLSCDLMEPFRPIIDKYVYEKIPFEFDSEMKFKIVNLLNYKMKYDGNKYHLTTVIEKYTKNMLKCISEKTPENLLFCEEYEV